MKKTKALLLMGFSMVLGFTSCDDDEPPVTPPTVDTEKSGVIDSDETWTSDNIYYLKGRVTVTNGATLTIEPGTIIKGYPGTGAVSSALLISSEGKLMANGTADKPIIFTSVADDIELGEINSPNMDATNNGLWGGIIILGNAPISASASRVQIEGIPTSDQNGLYGGTDANHNSGSITYVSIRHGGTLIGSGNEINGLTLGGVGSGTVINNIEVVANQDDGVEWFGGNVNVSNVVVWNSYDDAIDTDQDWTGTLDNFIVVNPEDRAFELDGPEGSSVSGDNFTLTNGTVYMGDGVELIDFDDNTNANMSNIYFFGLKSGQVVSGYSGFATAGLGSVSNIEVSLQGLMMTDIFPSFPTEIITEVGVNQNTAGHVNTAGFEWTWASKSGALAAIGL